MTPMIKQAATGAIARLHEMPHRVVMSIAGAGAGLQQLLWEVPGASRTILDCRFPYHNNAIADALWQMPDRFVNSNIAARYAVRAYHQGLEILQKDNCNDPVIGLGLTGAVASARDRKGTDRVHIACRTKNDLFYADVQFDKGMLDRVGQGELCDLIALRLLCMTAGIPDVELPKIPMYGVNTDSLNLGRQLSWSDIYAADDLVELCNSPLKIDHRSFRLNEYDFSNAIIYPMSANPLHRGHINIAKYIQEVEGKEVVCLISTNHPEKGQLDKEEAIRRLSQFYALGPVILYNQSGMYIDMAAMFKGCSFIIGVDVLKKLFSGKYLGESEERESNIEAMMQKILSYGTKFYIVGRNLKGLGWVSAMDAIKFWAPTEYKDLFIPVLYRDDVSSTELRNKMKPISKEM